MTKAISPLVVLASFLGMGSDALGQQEKTKTIIREVPRGERPKFSTDPGWDWLMRPQEFKLGHAWGVAREEGSILSGYSVVDADGGALRFFLVQAGPGIVETPGLRLVAFDAAGKSYLPRCDGAGGLKNRETEIHHSIFSLDPKVLGPARVAYIAVERMEPAARRDAP